MEFLCQQPVLRAIFWAKKSNSPAWPLVLLLHMATEQVKELSTPHRNNKAKCQEQEIFFFFLWMATSLGNVLPSSSYQVVSMPAAKPTPILDSLPWGKRNSAPYYWLCSDSSISLHLTLTLCWMMMKGPLVGKFKCLKLFIDPGMCGFLRLKNNKLAQNRTEWMIQTNDTSSTDLIRNMSNNSTKWKPYDGVKWMPIPHTPQESCKIAQVRSELFTLTESIPFTAGVCRRTEFVMDGHCNVRIMPKDCKGTQIFMEQTAIVKLIKWEEQQEFITTAHILLLFPMISTDSLLFQLIGLRPFRDSSLSVLSNTGESRWFDHRERISGHNQIVRVDWLMQINVPFYLRSQLVLREIQFRYGYSFCFQPTHDPTS